MPLGLGLYLANVVFPSLQDNTAGDLAMDAYLLVALMAAGALARRASARPGSPASGGDGNENPAGVLPFLEERQVGGGREFE